MDHRSLKFKNSDSFISEKRKPWFREFGVFVPPIFSFLDDDEWGLLEEWYKETEAKDLIGEAPIPFVSILQAFIMGNYINKIVQLGHYAGFSALLIGFMLRKMQCKKGLFTIDIDPSVSEFTRGWIKKAGLADYVEVFVSNSADEKALEAAKRYLNNEINLLIIDSSHQYEHTKEELRLWYPEITRGGFVVMHDSAEFADSFDSTGKGGVRRALHDWVEDYGIGKVLNISRPRISKDKVKPQNIYRDPCGIALIQKA